MGKEHRWGEGGGLERWEACGGEVGGMREHECCRKRGEEVGGR